MLSKLNIGDVFTPLKWCEFAIHEFNIFDEWLNGATIFDPTMGVGNMLESLILFGISKGFKVSDLPIKNLYGNELNYEYYKKSVLKFKKEYGVDISKNLTNCDILELKRKKFDIIFGNPPWQNYVDLPPEYKLKIKNYFFKYDLIDNPKELLLGCSRIDISALIIKLTIKDFLKNNGKAIFFMPLSLLLNDGANKKFREYSVNNVYYSISKIFDFKGLDVFNDISTRYCLASFIKDEKQKFPIKYFLNENGKWVEYLAKPIFKENDPLSIVLKDDLNRMVNIKPIEIKEEFKPRQGVNTCGANHIYFFDELTYIDDDNVQVSNKKNKKIILPKKFVYPLITSYNFNNKNNTPNKWVLIPYSEDGKPLEYQELLEYPNLKTYLESNK